MAGKLIRDRSTSALDAWWNSVLETAKCARKTEEPEEDTHETERSSEPLDSGQT